MIGGDFFALSGGDFDIYYKYKNKNNGGNL